MCADSTILKFNLNGAGHAINVAGSISIDTTFITQNIYKDSNSIFKYAMLLLLWLELDQNYS